MDIVPCQTGICLTRDFLLPCNWKKLPVTDFLVVRNHPEKDSKKGVKTMKITLKDGSVREYGQAMSVLYIASDVSAGLAGVAGAGEVYG